jgi:excisionase family DNA binding protein
MIESNSKNVPEESKRPRLLLYLEANCSDWEISNRAGWPIEEVRAEIAALQPGGWRTAPEGYFTVREAAKRLGMKRRIINTARRAGQLPFIRLRNRIFVRLEAVIRYRNNQAAVKKSRKLRALVRHTLGLPLPVFQGVDDLLRL